MVNINANISFSFVSYNKIHLKVSTAFHIIFDGLVQEGHNSIANALGLRLSCTNPLIFIPMPVSWPLLNLTSINLYQQLDQMKLNHLKR